jgi:WD40 repeat protein
MRCKLLPLSLAASMLVLTSNAAQQPPAAKDAFGDPLPDGAVARLGTVRWRHGGFTTFAAFLPDGTTVLSVSEDKTIRVWEYPSGKELRRIGTPAGDNLALGAVLRAEGGTLAALSPDGKTIAARFERNEVRLYDAASGKELAVLQLGDGRGLAGAIKGLAFMPGTQHLATLDLNGTVRIWDWTKNKQVRAFSGPSANNGISNPLVFSPDGKLLATMPFGVVNNQLARAIKIWDPATGNELRAIAPNNKFGNNVALVFSPYGKTLAFSSSSNGIITLLDTATGKEIRNWNSNRNVTGLLFSQDGTKIYTRSITGVTECETASGKELRELPLSLSFVGLGLARLGGGPPMALSPDGSHLFVAGAGTALLFLDVAAGKVVGACTGHTSSVLAAHFTPDGKNVITKSSDGRLLKWEAGTGKELEAIALPEQSPRAFMSPDGKVLATSRPALGLLFLDVATGKELGMIPPKDQPKFGNASMLFSPNGKMLAVRQFQDKKIGLYEVPSGKLLHSIPIVLSGPIGPRGGVDLAGDAPLMFFAPDSKTLAAFAGPDTVGVWDTSSGQRMGTLKPTSPTAAIYNGAFSPDGRCVALDLSDGTVALFEVASGQVRRTYGTKIAQALNPLIIINNLRKNLGGVNTLGGGPVPAARVAFAHNGQTLLHGGLDRNLHVWNVTGGRELAVFKGHAGAVNHLVVAADGKTVASASDDTTTLLWDLTRVARPAAVVKALSKEECDARWQALLGGDAAQAFAAICDLSAAPQQTVPLLKEHVKPAPLLDMKRVDELIAGLKSDQFKVRQQATDELQKMGERVVPALNKALAGDPPLETKKRLQDLHKELSELQGERLRTYRAVEVLERMGTSAARQLLQTLADGAPGAMVTTSAQEALVRLGQPK